MTNRVLGVVVGLFAFVQLDAQQVEERPAEVLDSLYILEVEEKKGPAKVLHAEPLFIDLIRDLGARKGEREWNIGMALTDNLKYDEYAALVEYEWAPIDRLGLEVELPFSFFYPVPGNGDVPRDSIPRSRLNSLKMAAQWSFYVSEKNKTSLALGKPHTKYIIAQQIAAPDISGQKNHGRKTLQRCSTQTDTSAIPLAYGKR